MELECLADSTFHNDNLFTNRHPKSIIIFLKIHNTKKKKTIKKITCAIKFSNYFSQKVKIVKKKRKKKRYSLKL